jgi:selenoprotein W-related protein
LTAKLLPRFKRSIRSFTMIPSAGGCFELKVGDRLLYSKLATGSFPDEAQLLEEVARALEVDPFTRTASQ